MDTNSVSSNNTQAESNTIYQTPDGEGKKKIVDKIQKRFDSVKKEHDDLVKAAETNTTYYYATYMKDDLDIDPKSVISVPKLFSNLETMVPIVTRTAPEPVVNVIPATKRNKKQAKLILQELKDSWQMSEENDGLEMQPKMEENTRLLFVQKVEIFKVYQDVDLDRMCVRVVPLDKFYAPLKKSNNTFQMPFCIELVTESLETILARFPEAEAELLEKLGEGTDMDSQIEYMEYWENDHFDCKHGDIFLGSFANPMFNPEGNNHFKRPIKPYIIDTDIKAGTGLTAKTSLVEINQSAVRAIDKREMQIDRNANLANGHYLFAGAKIDVETSEKIIVDGNSGIYLKGADSVDGAVAVLTGRSIDNAVVANGQSHRSSIDESTGMYGTVRGERESQETKGGREILKDSSYGRAEPIFRVNERVAQKIYNWKAQSISVFGNGDRPTFSASIDSSKTQKVDQSFFDGNKQFIITVKDGSSTPIDKKTLQAQAADDLAVGAISVLDYHRAMEADDPEGLALRAWQQINDPLKLYGVNKEDLNFNPEAVRHILGILNGEIDGFDPKNTYQSNNVDDYKAHVKTHSDWLGGEEIYEDIPSKDSIDDTSLSAIQQHMKFEVEIAKSLIQQQQAHQAQMDQMQKDFQRTQLAGQSADQVIANNAPATE